MTGLDIFQWTCCVAVFGAMLVLSQGRRWGWIFNIVASIMWLAYAAITKQYGLGALQVGMILVGARGWVNSEPVVEAEVFEGEAALGHIVIGDGRCCPMRRKFLTGITGSRATVKLPIEAADFIIHWSPTAQYGHTKAKPSRRAGRAQMILFGAHFCQWCGADIRDDVRDRAGGD